MHERQHAPRWAGPGYPRPADAGLSGTSLVADDLYLLAHDDRSGRALLKARSLGAGLAGALLAELMLEGLIGVAGRDSWVVIGQHVPPRTVEGHDVLKLISAEEPLPVRTWLEFIACNAPRDVGARLVGGRLVRAGYLTPVRSRIPGLPARLVPVNADLAFAPMLRVTAALDPSRPVSAYAAILAGLADACGLGFRIDQYRPQDGRTVQDVVAMLDCGLQQLTARAGRGLQEVITQTDLIVSAAVQSPRTT